MNAAKIECHRRERVEQRISELEKRGHWSVIAVVGAPGEPGFCYTVGLHSKGLPELIIFALPPHAAGQILNSAAMLMVEHGRSFPSGETTERLANLPTAVIDAPLADGFAYQAFAYYEDQKVKFQQLVWPDPKGIFPWEEGFAKEMVALQPILGEPAPARRS